MKELKVVLYTKNPDTDELQKQEWTIHPNK
jgi:hypothetical protein